MDSQRIVALALQVSIFLTVFGFGLRAGRDEVLYPFRRPAQLARALLAMFVLMPIVSIVLCVAFEFHPAVEIALVALAISPMPPLLTNRQSQAGGRVAYGIGLMVVAAGLSIVFIPVAVNLIGRAIGLPLLAPPGALVRLATFSVLLPLALGMSIRAASPALAARVHRPVMIVAVVGLTLTVITVLMAMLPAAVALIGNGTLLVLVIFVTVGIVLGHALGGPQREERAVVALSTACRHPAIAIAIAGGNFPQQELVPAAVLLYLLVNVVLSIAYILVMRHARMAEKAPIPY
jgi:BASS family bile acid:Na+ symporter